MSRKLFILGNGFDLFHQLPTTYYDLRNFFKKPLRYNDWMGVTPEAYYMNPITIMDSLITKVAFDDYNISSKRVVVNIDKEAPLNAFYMKRLKRKGIPVVDRAFLWGNFEEALGRIDFSEYLEDDDYDTHMIKRAFDYLQSTFEAWIKSIDISNVNAEPQIKELFCDSQNLFLTFNYTKTLEEVYNVPPENVCHIHGEIGKEIIFGHSGINEAEFLQKNGIPGYEKFAQEVFDNLTKQDKRILEKNKHFFKQIYDVTDIYVIGFSFSSCDLRYIAEICHRVPNANWHLNSYESEEKRKRIADIIRQFKSVGNIDSYTLTSVNNKRRKRSKLHLGKIIKGSIRYCIFKCDPMLERIVFGFDPDNEVKFFRKPYVASFVKLILLFFALILGFVMWICSMICTLFKKVIHILFGRHHYDKSK